MAKQPEQKHVDGVFYEYLPQTYTPAMTQFMVEVEKTRARLPRRLFTYLGIAAVIMLVQLAVFFMLLRAAGSL